MSRNRIIDLPLASGGRRLIIPLLALMMLQGCAAWKPRQEVFRPEPRPLAERIEQNEFSVAPEDDVVGRLASITLAKGDTLPDVARHFGLGLHDLNAANPGVDTWVPAPGTRITLPLSFILPDAPRTGIVINLAAMRLFFYQGNGGSATVHTFPVGVGTEERPSPMGRMYVARKAARPVWHVPASIAKDHREKGDPLPSEVPPGPENPLGEYALYLSKPSYLIHGTNKPASIGLRATNGCIRLYPESIRSLFGITPLKTPVMIVDQPYLVGQRTGIVYLEVHAPPDDANTDEFDRMYAKLRTIERDAGRTIDWGRVKKTLAEARGYPVPVFALRQGAALPAEDPLEMRHPAVFSGQPIIPALKATDWSVLAAVMSDEDEAVRLAAMITHQGPPIPARAVPSNDGYRVMAGPFADREDARQAMRRLKIDLALDASLIEPAGKR